MLVVPTSRRMAPLTPMMSGMRKLPPISMSCPREMTTSLPLRHGAQHDDGGGGVVVDGGSRFSAGQPAHPFADGDLPRRTFAAIEIEFQVEIAARRLGPPCRLLRERRTAEIGVQDDAGGIDDRSQLDLRLARPRRTATREATDAASIRPSIASPQANPRRRSSSSARMTATMASRACRADKAWIGGAPRSRLQRGDRGRDWRPSEFHVSLFLKRSGIVRQSNTHEVACKRLSQVFAIGRAEA